LSDIDCMLKFFDLVQPIVKFKEETFKCSLGVSLLKYAFSSQLFPNILHVFLTLIYLIIIFISFSPNQWQTGWTIPVELVVGCDVGIGYVTDKTGPVMPLTLIWNIK
jgi:hypothetical protein